MTACAAIQQAGQAGAPSWILVTAFIVIALLALALVYQFFIRFMLHSPGPAVSSEKFSSMPQGDSLVYMYIDGCMWCEKFSPEWDKLVKKQGAALSAAGVSYAKIDGHSDDPRIAGIDVKGFPMIVFIPAGASGAGAISFEGGSRSAATVAAFVAEHAPTFVPIV